MIETPGKSFFYECFNNMSPGLETISEIFKTRFPPLNGNFFNFSELDEDWQKGVIFTVAEALECGYLEIIDLIFEIFGEMIPYSSGPSSWTHKFHYDLKIVKTLHRFGAELDFLNKVGGMFDSTPLCASVKCNQPENVKYFLEMGSDPTIPDHYGVTPIEEAYFYDYFEIVKLLATPEIILRITTIESETNASTVTSSLEDDEDYTIINHNE